MTFKIGDKVRALRSTSTWATRPQFTKGNIYTVSDVNGSRIQIEVDDSGSLTNGWQAEYFELVTSVKEIDYIQLAKEVCGVK